MKKILLNGVDGNFGSVAAQVLLDRYPHTDLIFTAPTEKGLEKYSDMGIETRIANFNSPEDLIKTFSGADTVSYTHLQRHSVLHRASRVGGYEIGHQIQMCIRDRYLPLRKIPPPP